MKRAFSDFAPEVRAAVDAYDEARRELADSYTITGPGEPEMSDDNKVTIVPMIMAAVRAYIKASAR